jgi:hypothetical protein
LSFKLLAEQDSIRVKRVNWSRKEIPPKGKNKSWKKKETFPRQLESGAWERHF